MTGGNIKKLYFGGDIITMRNHDDNPQALVTENGKIIYVGDLKEAEALYKKDIEKVNLNGKTLMPSFIDPHSHFLQVAQSALMCDLSEVKNFNELIETLKKYMEENNIDEKGIIFGTGYDHNFLEEEKHPDKTILDKVSNKVPIYISHVSGHMGVANSALLKLANITDDTPDPEGGKFGRNQDGSVNGYIEETPALMKVLMVTMPRMNMDMLKQVKAAEEIYLKHGITTVQDGAAMEKNLEGLVKLALGNILSIDVVAYILADEYKKTVEKFPDYVNKYKGRVKIGGAKIILDGSPQGKSAWLSKPYEGEKEYLGYPTHDDLYVESAVSSAVKDGYQILAHCNGDAASDQFINSYEKALKSTPNPNMDLRPVMIHCQTVRDEQLDKMVDLKMIPSIFVGHTYYWGDIHLKNLGSVRGNHISPVKEALKRGLIYNFHQDAPVTIPNMLHSVWCAVNRITRRGQAIGQDQCIDVYDALKAITINAAYEYHEEKIKGSLEIGKLADMVILESNPLKTDKMKIKDIEVLETIKEGKTIYKA